MVFFFFQIQLLVSMQIEYQDPRENLTLFLIQRYGLLESVDLRSIFQASNKMIFIFIGFLIMRESIKHLFSVSLK